MILRYRPLRPAFDAFDDIDRMFNQLTHSFVAPARTPVVDAAWHDGALRLTVDLPGVPQDAIAVDVSGRTLTLTVQTDTLEWTRSMSLGNALDPEQVSARYEHGRLTVTVAPVAEAEKRSIPVQTGTAAIEASATDGAEAGEPADTTASATDQPESN